ncbi:hypothetical protein GCM10010247_67370 [Streptomyces calvus]|nr:hypothetical protein GCM10010247_67370 [Streptomyces calvus]
MPALEEPGLTAGGLLGLDGMVGRGYGERDTHAAAHHGSSPPGKLWRHPSSKHHSYVHEGMPVMLNLRNTTPTQQLADVGLN